MTKVKESGFWLFFLLNHGQSTFLSLGGNNLQLGQRALADRLYKEEIHIQASGRIYTFFSTSPLHFLSIFHGMRALRATLKVRQTICRRRHTSCLPEGRMIQMEHDSVLAEYWCERSALWVNFGISKVENCLSSSSAAIYKVQMFIFPRVAQAEKSKRMRCLIRCNMMNVTCETCLHVKTQVC